MLFFFFFSVFGLLFPLPNWSGDMREDSSSTCSRPVPLRLSCAPFQHILPTIELLIRCTKSAVLGSSYPWQPRGGSSVLSSPFCDLLALVRRGTFNDPRLRRGLGLTAFWDLVAPALFSPRQGASFVLSYNVFIHEPWSRKGMKFVCNDHLHSSTQGVHKQKSWM